MLSGAEYFARLQEAVIKRNLRLFDEFPQHEGRAIHLARQLIVREWPRRFRIERIADEQRIVQQKKLSGDAKGNRVGGPRAGGKRSRFRESRRTASTESQVSTFIYDSCTKRARVHCFARTIVHARAVALISRARTHTWYRNNEIRNGTSAPLITDAEPKEEEPHVSDFAKKMMQKMGHQKGQGLGKGSAGITAPIDASSRDQMTRSGLGHGSNGSMETDDQKIQRIDPSELIWIGKDILTNTPAGQFDGSCQRSWLKTGRKETEIKMSKFCEGPTLLKLLEVRSNLQLLQDKMEITRKYFGCYQIDSVGFVSRSALKLADIHSIFTIAMQHKMPDFSGIFNRMDGQDLSFIDLYGGKGGFSDFVLWKYGPSINRWWLLNRRGKKRPDLEAIQGLFRGQSCSTFVQSGS